MALWHVTLGHLVFALPPPSLPPSLPPSYSLSASLKSFGNFSFQARHLPPHPSAADPFCAFVQNICNFSSQACLLTPPGPPWPCCSGPHTSMCVAQQLCALSLHCLGHQSVGVCRTWETSIAGPLPDTPPPPPLLWAPTPVSTCCNSCVQCPGKLSVCVRRTSATSALRPTF